SVGFGPVRSPPKTARMEQLSTTGRDQSIWSERASQSSNAKCIRSQTPARCQSRRRRQHVIPDPHPSSGGSICQGMPLRRTKTMPVRHARSETRGRPPCGRRGRIGKKGSTRSHNRSGSNAAAIRRPRYFADEDQVREVLLRVLTLFLNLTEPNQAQDRGWPKVDGSSDVNGVSFSGKAESDLGALVDRRSNLQAKHVGV